MNVYHNKTIQMFGFNPLKSDEFVLIHLLEPVEYILNVLYNVVCLVVNYILYFLI